MAFPIAKSLQYSKNYLLCYIKGSKWNVNDFSFEFHYTDKVVISHAIIEQLFNIYTKLDLSNDVLTGQRAAKLWALKVSLPKTNFRNYPNEKDFWPLCNKSKLWDLKYLIWKVRHLCGDGNGMTLKGEGQSTLEFLQIMRIDWKMSATNCNFLIDKSIHI